MRWSKHAATQSKRFGGAQRETEEEGCFTAAQRSKRKTNAKSQ